MTKIEDSFAHVKGVPVEKAISFEPSEIKGDKPDVKLSHQKLTYVKRKAVQKIIGKLLFEILKFALAMGIVILIVFISRHVFHSNVF
jgi:hypothetical protein